MDGFLVETMSNTIEMTAARDALVAAGQSVRIGLTVEDDGTNRLRSGEPLSKAIEELSNGPTFANGITKTQLHQEWNMSIDQAIESEAQAQAICMQTQDFHRAYEAFVRKTKPEFAGN